MRRPGGASARRWAPSRPAPPARCARAASQPVQPHHVGGRAAVGGDLDDLRPGGPHLPVPRLQVVRRRPRSRASTAPRSDPAALQSARRTRRTTRGPPNRRRARTHGADMRAVVPPRTPRNGRPPRRAGTSPRPGTTGRQGRRRRRGPVTPLSRSSTRSAPRTASRAARRSGGGPGGHGGAQSSPGHRGSPHTKKSLSNRGPERLSRSAVALGQAGRRTSPGRVNQ